MDEANLANAINNADGLSITKLVKALEPSMRELIAEEIKKVNDQN